MFFFFRFYLFIFVLKLKANLQEITPEILSESTEETGSQEYEVTENPSLNYDSIDASLISKKTNSTINLDNSIIERIMSGQLYNYEEKKSKNKLKIFNLPFLYRGVHSQAIFAKFPIFSNIPKYSHTVLYCLLP